MATPRLGAPELVSAQATPETTVNEQIRYLESASGHFVLEDRDENDSADVTPSDGQAWLVAGTGAGDWTGHDGDIAYYLNTDWIFINVQEGFTFWVKDENKFLVATSASTFQEFSTSSSLTLASTVTQSGTPVATSVGFLGAPQISDQDDYTLALTDAGGHYYHVSGSTHTLTIPANASVAFPIGTVIAIVNENGAGNLSVAITSDTLRWGSSTGTRTIAANGTATLLKVTSTVWRMTGDGIT